MTNQTIYTVGGTVQAGGGIYIPRKADDELLGYCRAGEFAFILSSRQVGKSSLMVRTAEQLEKGNIHSVTIDLSAIGVKVSQDEWYLGILNEVSNSLNLKTDIFAWWTQYVQLGPAQRLINFFRDVLLKEVQEKVVLFFDEIDSTLSIPFSDDFYIALRAVYNARSTTPDFKRLSFVLVGVAAPSDLISDNKRTPFNIGRRVEINDFTLEEALPLADGLGQQATQILKWVFQYTSGHPYLTQRLCANLANSKDAIDEQAVAKMVKHLFTGEEGKQDNNLQFVRDMLSKRSPDVTKVLLTYKSIRSGKKVVADERSITQAHLKLSGLVRSERGILHVRNEIYNTVFNLRWVQESTPKNSQKIALIALATTLGIILLTTLAIFIHDFFVGSRVNSSIADFISTTSPTQRLSDLAQIYNQKGVLSNTDSSLQAAQLYYGLSATDQLSMFTDYGIDQNPDLQDDLVVVISHLYVTVADVDPNEDNTNLLITMRDSLSKASQNPDSLVIQKEITSWLLGREQARQGNYQEALTGYNIAINLNSANQATLYERAKVHVGLQDYVNALKDLDGAIGFARQSAPDDIEAITTPTVSTFSVSVTLSSIEEIPTNPLSSTPSLVQTTVPSEVGLATTVATTPALVATQLPTPTTLPTYVPISRYESNFTTLIDVINAVQALIEINPQLKVVVQSNGESLYTNLQSYKLVAIISPTPSSNLKLATTLSSRTELPAETTVANSDPSCTVLQDLNLRFGPGTAYRPPIKALPANSVITPLGFTSKGVPSGSWAYVQDSTTQEGWVSAGSEFISCDIEIKTLPVVAFGTPPTFPSTSSITVLDSTLTPTESFVIGADVSSFDNDPDTPQDIDFVKMKLSAGYVIIRAGTNLWVDTDFETNWREAKLAGLPRGSYWFYDSRVDPEKQAELWVENLGNDFGELPLLADFEEAYNGQYKGWENWRTFIEKLQELVPGKEIAIYTAYHYWIENAPNATTGANDLESFHQYPLWIADYGTTEPLAPKPWSKNEWLFWQYTDSGDGKLYGTESDTISLNYFNGDLDTFQARFGINK